MTEFIKNAKNIIILPHKTADGDCLGSSYALKLALKNIGKNAMVITEENPLPKTCKYLIGVEDYCSFDNADLVIAVDCGDKLRLGTRSGIFDNCDITLNIDHHPCNNINATESMVDITAAATGELIYEIAKELGGLDKDVAHNLYLALSSDSGCFKQSNTTSKTMRIAAELMDYGIDFTDINFNLFSNNSPEILKLIAQLYNSLEFYKEGKVCVLPLEYSFMEKYHITEEDAGKYAYVPREVEGVEIAIYIKEIQMGVIKVSFRCNIDVDLGAFATKFNGGGHKRASACRFLDKSMEDVKKILVDEVTELLN